MSKIAVYETSTGRVVQCFMNSTSAEVSAVLATGQAAIAVADDFDDSTHYIASGSVAAITSRSSAKHVYDWSTHAWVDPRTLAQVKADRWEFIKAAREAAIDEALDTPYGTFDANETARANLASASVTALYYVSIGEPDTDTRFTLTNNTRTTLTAAQMVDVWLLLDAKVQAAYDTSDTLRTAINSKTTAADVATVEWPE